MQDQLSLGITIGSLKGGLLHPAPGRDGVNARLLGRRLDARGSQQGSNELFLLLGQLAGGLHSLAEPYRTLHVQNEQPTYRASPACSAGVPSVRCITVPSGL